MKRSVTTKPIVTEIWEAQGEQAAPCLDGDHHDSGHVAAVDGGFGPHDAEAVIAQGKNFWAVTYLCHGHVTTAALRVPTESTVIR